METGKQRAARIPLDYFKRSDRIQRWKVWLTAAAAALVLIWWASTWVRGERGRSVHSPGQLAMVHATWETECQACHVPFQPLASKLGLSSDAHHAMDQRCEQCHRGPAHHDRQLESDAVGCASCHRDHRGRDVSLVRVADSDCTRCHAKIAGHRLRESPSPLTHKGEGKRDSPSPLTPLPEGEGNQYQPDSTNVTRFDDKNHPEFRSLLDPDPGKLKFNHKLHGTTGMVLAEGGKPFTLADIRDPQERERYRQGQPTDQRQDNHAVRLDCGACHRLDNADFNLTPRELLEQPAASILRPRSSGAYMQPIVYDNQCKACHPLLVERPASDDKPGLSFTVPHRLDTGAMHKHLENAVFGRLIADKPGGLLDESFIPDRPMAGKEQLEAVKKKARELVADRVHKAEKLLYLSKQMCGECHSYSPLKNESMGPHLIQPGAAPRFSIQPTNVPDVWLKSASFNHAKHHAVDCRDCHARAEAGHFQASTRSEDVLIAGKDSCLKCHGPSEKSASAKQGGARFDCIECHRYHNGDHQRQGLGAAVRDPAARKRLDDFLSGGSGK